MRIRLTAFWSKYRSRSLSSFSNDVLNVLADIREEMGSHIAFPIERIAEMLRDTQDIDLSHYYLWIILMDLEFQDLVVRDWKHFKISDAGLSFICRESGPVRKVPRTTRLSVVHNKAPH